MARCPFCKEEINELKAEISERKVGFARLNEWERIYFCEREAYPVGKEIYRCPKCERSLPLHNEVEAEAFLRGFLRIVPKEDIPEKKSGKLGRCLVDSEDRPYEVLREENGLLVVRRSLELETFYRELDDHTKERIEIIRLP